MKPIFFASIMVPTVLLAAVTAYGQEDYAANWSHHRDVFLNTTATGANVTADVADFPVLVRLDSGSAAVFADARGDGADIRFTGPGDSARLHHEIGHWDSAGQSAAIWVRVDTVKGNSGENLIRMHWGNASAADSSDGTAVFSNGFTNVWHLGNAPDADPRPNAIDGGNPAAPTNFPGEYSAQAGVIGLADHFRGGPGGTSTTDNDYLNLGTITTDYSNGFTFSVWIHPEVEGSGTVYYSASENNSDAAGLILAGIQGDPPGAKFRQRNSSDGGNVGIINGGFGDLTGPTNVWRHLVFTKAAGTGDMTVYMNGVLAASDFGGGSPAFSGATRAVNQLGITLAHMDYNDEAFVGLMEEARLADTERSAAWVKLENENQKSNQALVFFDSLPPVSLGGGSPAVREGDLFVQSAGGTTVFRMGGNPHGARLSVLDLRGRTVWSGTFAPGTDRLEWTGTAGRAGMHVARLARFDARGKIVEVTRKKLPPAR